MIEVPACLAILLVAAACIGASGAPGVLWRRRPALGRWSAVVLNGFGSLLGCVGLVLHARDGEAQRAALGSLPVGSLEVGIDGISALFLVPILVVSALGSLYGAGYWREEHAERGPGLRLWWGLTSAAMLAVVLARDAILFLIAWEVMAVSAFFLICAEAERREVRRAAWIYLAATHAGTLCLIGCFALLAHAQGSFVLWRSLAGEVPGWLATAIFALGVVGFGLKAGLVPLHVWLPGAHANAPSHVSALLSGVLIKMGVFGLVRVCALFPEPPVWWGSALLGVGVATGLVGIMLAAAQQDLKRLLAYSSVENVGIIAMGLGLASIGRALGAAELVALGLGAALLHVLNHSLMKPLLFLTVGSVVHATGTRRLSSLGGLAHAMPGSFALFVLGAVAICGLPPLNGFASELVLYLGLLRGVRIDPLLDGCAWVGLAAPALAMIGALAVAAFVKAIGIAFCGSPRSAGGEQPHDPGPCMLAPMVALAIGCVLLGLAPGVALPLVHAAVVEWDPARLHVATSLAALVPLGWISGLGMVALTAFALLAALFVRRRGTTDSAGTWDCGYARPTPRMQYAAGSFSETLSGLFGWVVRARQARPVLRGIFPSASRFESDVPDAVLDDAVLPLLRAADRGLSRLRPLQAGPVQMYLLYILLALVALLLVAR